MPTKEKIDQVANLKQRFEAAPSVAVTDYAGLTVEKITLLRKQFRDADMVYLVAKNSLLKIAAKDAGLEELNQFLQGPTAIAYGTDDPGVLAKTLFDFGKENEKPEIKALYIDGRLYGSEDAERIAKLPPRDQLIAEVIGNITAPIQNLIGTLEAVIRDFVGTIEAIKEKVDK